MRSNSPIFPSQNSPNLRIQSQQGQPKISSKLKDAPKKDLFDILLSLKIPFDYAADSETLAKLIENRIESGHNTNNNNSSIYIMNFYKFCHLLFVISLLLAFFLFLLMLIIWAIPKKTTFCDSLPSNKTKQCIKCPAYAKCQNGIALCDLNYTLVKKKCIFNDNDRFDVSSMLEIAYKKLRSRAGEYHCKTIDFDWISLEELENILLSSSKISKDRKIFHRIFNKTLEHLAGDNNILQKDIGNQTVFASLDIDRDLRCRIKMAVFNRMDYVIILSIGCFVVLVLISFIINRRRQKNIASRYSSFLINRIKMKNGNVQTTQQLITELNKVSNNQGNRIWPLIEKQLSNSPMIQCITSGNESKYRYVF